MEKSGHRQVFKVNYEEESKINVLDDKIFEKSKEKPEKNKKSGDTKVEMKWQVKQKEETKETHCDALKGSE